jgi:phosphate:Na+ symporter
MQFGEIDIWRLLAGLGLFLFGMYMLEDALKALVGRSFKRFLRKHTAHRIKAVLSGALITAILQSSSMVVLLVMSFVGAGIIGFKNGLGMILGANLGTTMTGWLVSLLGFKLSITNLIMPFIAVGGLGIIFLKTQRLAQFSRVLMGFSFMFMGLDFMKNGFAEFAQQADLSLLVGKPPILFFLIGAALTALIQSSSAGMMIFLSSLATGVVSLEQALYLVIGGDLGTTMTALLGTLTGTIVKKRVGWSQFFFNSISAILGLSLMPLFIYLITDLLAIKDPLIAVVTFHSLLNLTGIIVVLPFLTYFVNAVNYLIKDTTVNRASYLTNVNPAESQAALEALEKEVKRFLKETLVTNSYFFGLQEGGARSTDEAYFALKSYETEIINFYIPLQQASLTNEEVILLNRLVAAVRNATLSIKDLKDIKHNLDELKGAVKESYALFHNQIAKHQKDYYAGLSTVFEHFQNVELRDLTSLRKMHEISYRDDTHFVYTNLSEAGQTEVNLPSLLNMIRGIHSSNEALLRATSHYLPQPSA